MNRWKWIVGVGVVCLAVCTTAEAGRIVAWGNAEPWVFDVPEGDDFVAVAGGYGHALALREDGSIAAWGRSNLHGELDMPEGVFVAVDVGDANSYALREDGTIAAWGTASQSRMPKGRFLAIAAARGTLLGPSRHALREDGSVIYFGGEACWLPPYCEPIDGHDFVAISATGNLAALRADGSVATTSPYLPPAGNDFVAVAGGGIFSLALREDGSIAGWGQGAGFEEIPEGDDFAAIAAGTYVGAAIRTDGSLVAWGHDKEGYGQLDVPAGKEFVAVDLGGRYGLAIQVPEPSVLIGLISATAVGFACVQRHGLRKWTWATCKGGE